MMRGTALPSSSTTSDVGRLKVAVYDRFLVSVLHAFANFGKEFNAVANGPALLVAIPSDGNAGDVLHDEVRLAVGSGAGVEDLGDSGMIHARERLAFRFEALQENVVGHIGANELQRYETAQGSGLLRKPHLPPMPPSPSF